jgi:hypothetical protein
MSADLVSSTVAATFSLGLGGEIAKGSLSPRIITLSEGVLKSMLLIKVKTVLVAILLLGMTTLGAGALITPGN